MDNKNFNGYSPYNSYDQGSGYMNGVSNAFGQARELFQQKVIANSFLYMFIALIISAISAKVASVSLLMWIFQGEFNLIILCVAELAVVLIANVALKANNAALSAIMLAVYAAINQRCNHWNHLYGLCRSQCCAGILDHSIDLRRYGIRWFGY